MHIFPTIKPHAEVSICIAPVIPKSPVIHGLNEFCIIMQSTVDVAKISGNWNRLYVKFSSAILGQCPIPAYLNGDSWLERKKVKAKLYGLWLVTRFSPLTNQMRLNY